MQATDIIDRLIASIGGKNRAGLARFLEITPTVIYAAERRGRIPEDWLFKVAYKTLYSVYWLRTGRGDKFRVSGEPKAEVAAGARESTAAYEATGSFTHKLLSILEGLIDDEERQTLLRCAEALRVGDPEIREHLVVQLKIIEEAVKNRRAKRGRGRAASSGEKTG